MSTRPGPGARVAPTAPAAVFVLSALLAPSALAHAEVGVAGGLQSGFLHPFLGPSHLIAMVAVGLWGAQLGNPAIWLLPIAFPMLTAVGCVLGVLDVALPFVDAAIAASAVVLGLLVASATRLPIAAAILVVAAFAVFHGHSHGAALPSAANPLAYGTGFVVATGLLHLCGITIGLLTRWPLGARVVQACGAVVAVLGGYFLSFQTGLLA